MVDINHKPTISHIIEKFPESSEFIIPVGYKGKILQNYLKIAHPNLNIKTKFVENFDGEGSGLGLTLLEVFDFIDKPFVFISADTIVTNPIPSPDENWIGYSKVVDNSEYRTVEIQKGVATKINEKLSSESPYAYIGLTGVNDFENFKKLALEDKENFISIGESLPISRFISEFKPLEFDWLDTGNTQKLTNTRNFYKESDNLNFNILDKPDEKIWFVGSKVIKFSNDKKFISDRALRSNVLKKFVPKITENTEHMYSYNFEDGQILSDAINEKVFVKLLEHLEIFWKPKLLKEEDKIAFYQKCYEFYKDKSFDRFEKFSLLYPYTLREINLNGKKIENPANLLEQVDWKLLSSGTPVNFHGDLHFENILLTKNKFIFLDWRQNFNSLIDYGDIYYDLAKLLHGILLPHSVVKAGQYSIVESENDIKLEINLPKDNSKFVDILKDWVIKNDLDYFKVELITALIYINIAPLHHHPYSKFLFYYGIEQLDNLLNNE